jgi:hypothetical protein
MLSTAHRPIAGYLLYAGYLDEHDYIMFMNKIIIAIYRSSGCSVNFMSLHSSFFCTALIKGHFLCYRPTLCGFSCNMTINSVSSASAWVPIYIEGSMTVSRDDIVHGTGSLVSRVTGLGERY